jgi:predicted RNase H-like HicB family nuclease
MRRQFTLEYWRDGDWYVGRLLEVPSVFSQGETLGELREIIQDVYLGGNVRRAASTAETYT